MLAFPPIIRQSKGASRTWENKGLLSSGANCARDMNWEWIAKINNPVTLTAFALGLVFWAMSSVKRYRWWPLAAMCLAAVTVIGGLALAYIREAPPLAPNALIDINQPGSSASPAMRSEHRTEKPSAVNTPDAALNIQTKGDGAAVNIGSQIKGNNTITIIKGKDPSQ